METLVKEEQKQFIEMVDGNQYKYLIANPNHESNCPQKGVIRIEAIRRSNIKQPRYSFSKIYDEGTGVTYGVPMGIDKATGGLIFKRIIVGEVSEYNCSNPTDRALWCAISRSERLAGSPFQNGKPLYKKFDSEEVAMNIIKDSNNLVKAIGIAAEITGADFYDMSINLGLSPDQQSPTVLRSLLIKKATEVPNDFMEIYDNVNRAVINVFRRCQAVGLIKSTLESGWVWKDTYPLGGSDAAAIATISKNPALASQMDLESKKRSTGMLQYARPDEITSTTFGQPLSEIETKKQQSELLSTNALKAEMQNVQNLKAELTEELNEIKAWKKEKEVEAELAAKVLPDDLLTLQEMAFKLGWAGANLCNDVDVLKKQIKQRTVKK